MPNWGQTSMPINMLTAVECKTGGGRMPRNTRPDQIGTGGRITPEYAVRRYAPMIKGEVRGFSVELGRIRKGREFRSVTVLATGGG